MDETARYQSIFEQAFLGILARWSVWFAEDELRAIHIGFDCWNTQITISLLSDREPHLEQEGIDPLGEHWPAADWRLADVGSTFRHPFPDAAEVLDWMASSARAQDAAENAFDQQVKVMLFEAATSAKAREFMGRFRRVASPLRLRVAWFFDEEPLDACIELP